MLNYVTDIRFMCVQHIIYFILFLLLYLSRFPWEKFMSFLLYMKKKKKREREREEKKKKRKNLLSNKNLP